MKKILFITTKYGDKEDNKWLTNEMCLEFKSRGYDVYALVLSWLPMDSETRYKKEMGINVLRYKLPNFFYKDNKIVKLMKMILFPFLVKKEIKSYFKGIKFDIVLSSTPCITLNGLTKFFKKRDNSYNYLVLWDFFPYYLLDLGLIKKGLRFNILYEIERRMYNSYDMIGCMTKKNIQFLKEKYNFKKDRVEILPLWTEVKKIEKINKLEIRKKYKLGDNEVIFVYGGAMSIVQNLQNIINIAIELKDNIKIKFLFIGKGTESTKLKEIIDNENLKNIVFLDYIPREDYEKLLGACDVGIVSLSEKLNVPSFPSKTIDYFKVGLPILAAIDRFTDYGFILEHEMKAGEYSEGNNLKELVKKTLKLANDKKYREELGKNGNIYYKKNFCVKNAANIIEKRFNK